MPTGSKKARDGVPGFRACREGGLLRRRKQPARLGQGGASATRVNLHVVGALAMLGDVEALAFRFRGDAQADQR